MTTDNTQLTQDSSTPQDAQAETQKTAETEAEMRAKMIAQHRSMRCVGCGEGEEYF